MKRIIKKISISVLIFIVGTTLILIISYYRYDLFVEDEIKIEPDFRRLEMYNSIFHPFFNDGDVIDYYDKGDSLIKGMTTYENGKLVKRIRYYENGQVWFEVPIKYCSKHGQIKHYFDNGNLQYTVDSKYGFLNGKAFEYNINGQVVKKIDFKNDTRHGDYFEYDTLGKVILHEKYTNGKILE